jgi:hypothetical protein
MTDTIKTLLEAIGELSIADQWKLVEETQKGLKKASKPSKSKKTETDSDGEPKAKKEPNTWIKHTQHVRAILKSLVETHPDAKKATAVTQVSKALKDAGLLFLTQEAADADKMCIVNAFRDWQLDPPAPKEKAEKKSKKGSDSDTETEKPKRVWSEETKAKAALKRAATKAAKSGTASVASTPAPVEPPVADEEEEEGEEAVVKTYNLDGKGPKTYNTFKGTSDDTEYIYGMDGTTFLGLYNTKTKKLDKKAKNPASA